MKQSLLAMLNDTEQGLVRETQPARLAQLGEDDLIELHVRIRRARTKYTKLHRRGAAQRVSKDASRGRASATNQKAAAKAEIFEDLLARVSRRLATVARAAANELRAERLNAARKDRSGSASRQRAQPRDGSGARVGRKAVKRGGDNQLRSPIAEKGTAATRATGKRRQAKRDGR